jgi:phage-related protein
MRQISLKTIVWIGSSLNDVREFPEDVHDIMGYALYLAQTGGKHQSARPLKGFGGAKV